jgi:hypothetical protein
MDSGSGITGGGPGYAAILARGRSFVRYGTRLGDLEENWFLLFANYTHNTHIQTSWSGSEESSVASLCVKRDLHVSKETYMCQKRP